MQCLSGINSVFILHKHDKIKLSPTPSLSENIIIKEIRMLVLDNKEKYIIKRFLNTDGYVLNFSTSSFDLFTFQSVGIKLCEKYGLSKGRSLESFIDEASTPLIIQLTYDLIEHYEIIKEDLSQDKVKDNLYVKVKEILDKFSYLTARIKEESPSFHIPLVKKYDVFISHATKDKLTAANDLRNEIMSIGVDVWYDSDSIEWGDSLSSKIDEGLKNCEFGIVVLSRHFFDRPWCEKELYKLAERQKREQRKTILPLLLDISVEMVVSKYPFLEDIKMIEYKSGDERDISLLFAKVLIRRLKQGI